MSRPVIDRLRAQRGKGPPMWNYLHIDNYKCFVNFECKPQTLHLLLGDNGSGEDDGLRRLRNATGLLTARNRIDKGISYEFIHRLGHAK